MSGEFRQCQTFYIENVGGNVGGILLIYENSSVSRCLVVSHVSISTNTLSVFYTNKMWLEIVRMSTMTVMTELF